MFVVGSVWSQVSVGSVGALGIILVDAPGDSPVGIDGAVVLVEVNLGTVQGSPEPFDSNVVSGPSSTVHADLDFVVSQDFLEVVATELGTLVGVEDFRVTPAGEGSLECRDTKVVF